MGMLDSRVAVVTGGAQGLGLARALIGAARSEFGGIDVMVNNAGITRDASLKNMTLGDVTGVVIEVAGGRHL